MNTREQTGYFYYRKTKGAEVEILRVFAPVPYVELPSEIDGCPVTKLGNYCFAPACTLPKETLATPHMQDAAITQVCGNYLESVRLPASMHTIGDYAFYNCRCLHSLEFTPALQTIGSDAFMNCQKLQQLFLRCSAASKTGLRQVLAQIPWNVEVTFLDQDKTVLFYLEYYEAYDEIAPAHIFGRKIVGEGFRARLCFQDDMVAFSAYDAIFPKARVEESAQTLCKIAFYRLQYPFQLSACCRQQYADFILAHKELVCQWFVQERKLTELLFLFSQKLLPIQQISYALSLAAYAGWSEGSAAMLRLKQRYGKEGNRNNYTFEDF